MKDNLIMVPMNPDNINGVPFWKLIRDSLAEEFSPLLEAYDDKAKQWDLREASRSFTVGSVDSLPQDIKLFWDNPSNYPKDYRSPYTTYMRRLATTFVVCEDYFKNKRFENPVFLYFDGWEKYEIIAGAHRCMLFDCIKDVKISANIFYDTGGFIPPLKNMKPAYDWCVDYEQVGDCYRFDPKLTNVDKNFNQEYLSQILEFIEFLKDEPKFMFYMEGELLFETPSRSSVCKVINLSHRLNMWVSIMQFVLDYYFEFREFKNETSFQYLGSDS